MRRVMQLLILLVIFISTNAMAMWSFDISDADDNGTYELFFLSDEDAVNIDSFSLGFGYDQEELIFQSVDVESLDGYFQLGPVDYSTPGSIVNLTLMTMSGASIAPNTLVASFSFDVIEPFDMQDQDPDFYFMNWGNTEDGNIGINIPSRDDTILFQELAESGMLTYGDNVDKGQVPIPSSLLLLGSGLFGFVAIRKRGNK
jgi:hypothetical protein